MHQDSSWEAERASSVLPKMGLSLVMAWLMTKHGAMCPAIGISLIGACCALLIDSDLQ